jgi:hypothetical protein
MSGNFFGANSYHDCYQQFHRFTSQKMELSTQRQFWTTRLALIKAKTGAIWVLVEIDAIQRMAGMRPSVGRSEAGVVPLKAAITTMSPPSPLKMIAFYI